MTKLLSVTLAITLAIAGICASASAQGQGRPDPTGQERYLMFGYEQSYPGARVLTQLPPGAKCASAGELIGAQVWNSTRPGYAILSELTDKAQVATFNGRIVLCKCVRGYNELFLQITPQIETPAPVEPEVITEQEDVDQRQRQKVIVKVRNVITVPTPVAHHAAPARKEQTPGGDGWCGSKKCKVGILAAIAAAALCGTRVICPKGGGPPTAITRQIGRRLR